MPTIAAKCLTTFSVAADGETVSLGFLNENDEPSVLALPTVCIKELMLSLPDMMRQSLSRKYCDQSLRLIYPVDAWALEASSEPGRLILTLRTPDKFEIAFAFLRQQIADIASTTAAAEGEGLLRGIPGN